MLDWDIADFNLGGAIKNFIISSSNFKLSNFDDVRDFLTPKLILGILTKISHNSSISGIVNLLSARGTTIREAAREMLIKSGYEFLSERVLPNNSILPHTVGGNSKLISYFPNLELIWQPSILE